MSNNNLLLLDVLDTMTPTERLEFERGLVSSSSLSDDLLSRLETLESDKSGDDDDALHV